VGIVLCESIGNRMRKNKMNIFITPILSQRTKVVKIPLTLISIGLHLNEWPLPHNVETLIKAKVSFYLVHHKTAREDFFDTAYFSFFLNSLDLIIFVKYNYILLHIIK